MSPLMISLAMELVSSSTCDSEMYLDLGLALLNSSSRCEAGVSSSPSLINIILLKLGEYLLLFIRCMR